MSEVQKDLKKEVMIPKTIMLSPDMKRAMKDLAYWIRRSESDLIREGIDYILAKYKDKVPQPSPQQDNSNATASATQGRNTMDSSGGTPTDSGQSVQANGAEILPQATTQVAKELLQQQPGGCNRVDESLGVGSARTLQPGPAGEILDVPLQAPVNQMLPGT